MDIQSTGRNITIYKHHMLFLGRVIIAKKIADSLIYSANHIFIIFILVGTIYCGIGELIIVLIPPQVMMHFCALAFYSCHMQPQLGRSV